MVYALRFHGGLFLYPSFAWATEDKKEPRTKDAKIQRRIKFQITKKHQGFHRRIGASILLYFSYQRSKLKSKIRKDGLLIAYCRLSSEASAKEDSLLTIHPSPCINQILYPPAILETDKVEGVDPAVAELSVEVKFIGRPDESKRTVNQYISKCDTLIR